MLTGDTTGLTLKAARKKDGSYAFINIPIGSYTLTFSHDGFEISKVPSIPVQENRTGTINIVLKVGSINTTVEVVEQPLLNTVDTTNGYVLDSQQIQETPLPTGSFTRLAVLTPGVSSELQHGIGTNAGLGNAPIWANGQRDTSNMFQVNGVDVTNLFNGKSSSQSASQRYSFNIGQGHPSPGKARPISQSPDRTVRVSPLRRPSSFRRSASTSPPTTHSKETPAEPRSTSTPSRAPISGTVRSTALAPPTGSTLRPSSTNNHPTTSPPIRSTPTCTATSPAAQ